MAYFRYQFVSVGRWRGKIKRWNTTFHYPSNSAAFQMHDWLQQVGWPNPGDVLGDCSGGVASVSVYNPTGGAPVSETVYFDWQDPSSWIPYTGTIWSGVDPDTPIDASGESALIVVGHMPGLSTTGKPITTRKYLHAVPSRTAADFGDPDVSPANATAIATLFQTQWMGNAAGVTPTSVTVEPYYGNHQRVRGRRRTVKSVAANSFSAGVVVGAQPSVTGDGSFRNGQ